MDDTESDRAERKETFKGDVPKKSRQTICAFVNDLPNHNEPGILFIGANENGEPSGVSGARIQFLRIDGTELSDPVIDEENIGGTMVEMLRRTEEKLKAHNRAVVISSHHQPIFKEMPYPSAAIQQILYSAVLHRTYEGTNAPVRIY